MSGFLVYFEDEVSFLKRRGLEIADISAYSFFKEVNINFEVYIKKNGADDVKKDIEFVKCLNDFALKYENEIEYFALLTGVVKTAGRIALCKKI
ncbi:hypothetical protein [Campylobacter ureolyticus]|uniref:Uncharacterized protein n=1 Tax=Campylobacter ureolyticus TaxID=827 RepID=A0AAE7EA97_9BACT|nr:hypothetical protein [Campylobacter ureolyticus]MCR8685246.1 hypothetical protein [Campylobacter ureolyticus]QKF84579.1 hypothetical protein CURT_1102 [Campylobacter ureolyticus]QQY35258.1 hypothetical protein I6I59_07000 [Campylobacter ureolyticus]SUX22104.1 Uncharacterised protein [Campylobacter ureolyticus]